MGEEWWNVTLANPDLLATEANGTALPTADDVRDEQLATVEIAIQALILLAAVVGNSFVLLALCHQRRFRPMSRMYLFMLHLSIADLLVAAFSIFPQLVWDITFRFQGGDVSCRLVKYLQVMVLYLSTYILVMMAIDRYRAVCWSATVHWNSLRLAKTMIAAAWLISLVAAVPQAVIFRKMAVRPGVDDCWADFVKPWGDKAYVTWFVVSIFVVPLVVITWCYSVICYKIWTYNPARQLNKDWSKHQNGDCMPLRPLGQQGQDAGPAPFRRNGISPITQAKMKTVKLTLIVVICFFVCWSPFCVTQLVLTFNPPSSDVDVGPIEVIFLLLASLNSCTNPWIYLAFSGSLLNQLRVCLGLGLTRPKDNASIGDEEPDPQHHKGLSDGPNGVILSDHANSEPSDKIPSTRSEMV